MSKLIKLAFRVSLSASVISTALIMSACGSTTDAVQATSVSAIQPSGLQVTHVDAQGAHELLSEKSEATVLDVRTPQEIEGGHIEGAIFVNFNDDDFAQKLTKLDRNTPYIVHCKGGGRSTKALTTLEELGFTNVTHMDGGLDSWKRQNLPLTKP